ncbi:MAG: translation initiation factor IF-3 [Deltaproteobacteria bacterium]|nr:translation initiation factor IF-3 [Deltaproteobacteria bacterium]
MTVSKHRSTRREIPPINENIKVKEVRLISEKGEQIGIVSIDEALNKAREKGLDLVTISSKSKPVVCKIMDYGKYKYEQQKKEQKAKKKHKLIKLKEVKIRPRIADADYNVKVLCAHNFLKENYKVKFNIFFKGREFVKHELVDKLIERLKTDLADVGKMEGAPQMLGRRMAILFLPK